MFALDGLFRLLIFLMLGGLVVYVCIWILSMLTLPQPVKTVISVIVAIIVLVWLLSTMGVLPAHLFVRSLFYA